MRKRSKKLKEKKLMRKIFSKLKIVARKFCLLLLIAIILAASFPLEIRIVKDGGQLKFEFKKKEAHAQDSNMMLFWDGNCASPPSGWTVVSDNAGEAFYDTTGCGGGGCGGLFPRGNSSYSRLAGGALTHTHTATVTDTGGSGAALRSGTGSTANSNAHTHTGTYTSVTNVSSLPAYTNLCVIQYSGIPTTIPSGAIAIFDQAVPGGWTDVSSSYSSYPYIRGNSSAGGTGGSNTHQGTGHVISGITLSGIAGTVAASGTSGNYISAANHTHTVADQTSDTPDTEPQHITIILGKANSDTSIPSRMIAMFDGSTFSSGGWQVLSGSGGPFNQRFLKVTGAYGTQSGAAQHTHAAMTPDSTSYTALIDTKTGIGAISNHYHTTNIALADGTNTNRPPFTDVVIAKKSYVFTSLTTDKGSYPSIGETITADAQVDNYSNTNLTGTYIDYVIFIDGNSNNQPDAGETYVTSGCAGSGSWSSGNYTWQKTGLAVNANSFATDSQNCANTNFPEMTDYVLWAKWWDGASITYGTKYTTFYSVPTLGFYLLILLAMIAVYITYRAGYLKFNRQILAAKTSSLALRKHYFKVRDLGFGKEKVIDLKKIRKFKK